MEQILAVSGSCSPVTADQIERALAKGYTEIAVDPSRLLSEESSVQETARLVETALGALSAKPGVILHTCKGPGDPRIAQTKRFLERLGYGAREAAQALSQRLGASLGELLRALVEKTGIRRAVVAGETPQGLRLRRWASSHLR